MICRVQEVGFTYRGASQPALACASLEVPAGTHVAVVGPNGAGKSTLLRLIAGTLRPDSGSVEVFGKPSAAWDRRELARRLAVVTQAPDPAVGISVRELVEMGRNPYLRPWAALGPRDQEIVEASLQWTDVGHLAGRDVRTLSGGELQRARLARAFAQEPRLLMLDEPTAHLDLGHEMRVLELVAQWIAEKSLTVVSVTHHLNTVARFADRMVLLRDGAVLADGSPADVMTSERLGDAYEWPIEVRALPDLGPQAVPVRGRCQRGVT